MSACRFVASAAGVIILRVAVGCTGRPGPDPASGSAFPVFSEVASASGIRFDHDDGFDGKRYRVAETVNGGVGLLDYNGDGLLDIFFTNAHKLDPGPSPPRNALYRQGAGSAFTDQAREAGVDDSTFSLGCSIADVDGDGDSDIYVTNLGPNRLYRSSGDGTFKDIAVEAGVASPSMDSGSAFLDMDEDGDLDLYVASYVIDEGKDHPPLIVRGVPGYWPPRNYTPAQHHLYSNDGACRFVDVSRTSGILDAEPGRGLGVLSADFNDDGHADLYVANDMSANYLFLGDGKGRFVEAGLMNGAALGEEGDPLGSMGVDAADYDGDSRLDICVTNYQDQINNLYRASTGGSYVEMARAAGIASGVLMGVSWGVGFFDFDNDGWVDLFIANGHLNRGTHEMDESTSYAQPKRLFRNMANGRFENVTEQCGEAVSRPRVSRGAAFGDLDNDGDIDVVVLDATGGPEILRNDGGNRQSWCCVEVVGAGHNRSAIGARVAVTAGGRSQSSERRSSGSYLSVNDYRLHFGLGTAESIDKLEIRWPDGSRQSHVNLPARKLLRVIQGKNEVDVIVLRGGSR